jgi:hypothetical protein
MFCKQGESVDGTRLICSACDQVSMLYAGKPLCPAAVNMDCSDAFRAGVLMVWPDSRACCTKLVCYLVLLMDGYLLPHTGPITCWPHINNKVLRGEYMRKVRTSSDILRYIMI